MAAGALIDAEVLRSLAAHPGPIAAGVLGTLALSLACGQVLRLSRSIDRPTAIFASIAGGASGVSAVAREVGADETTVLSLQYLRVLSVLVTVPLVALVGGSSSRAAAELVVREHGWPAWAFTALAMAVGLLLARLVRFSASGVVLPMLSATALSMSGLFEEPGVPYAVLDFGYATTGLAVGLSFSRPVVRRLGRLLPLAVAQVALSVVACAGLGMALAATGAMSQLDAYLATSPGGLPAVTAVAISSGADVGLIVTMQLLRVFVALLVAPLIGRCVRRTPRRRRRRRRRWRR